MNTIIKNGLTAIASLLLLTACDWTEPEAIDLRYDTIQEVASDSYAKYLSGLRSYRNNGHKKVYAWFDNKSSFVSQADHVSAVPDSIDVLVLNHPEAISQATLDEIDTKRSETGMQTAYVVSYSEIRSAWEIMKEDETPEAPAKEWSVFLADSLASALSFFNGGGYDRLICSYDGKDMTVYGPEDREAYAADQKQFLDAFGKWRAANTDKGFDFIGIPKNIIDTSLLAEASTIFLSETANATNVSEYSLIIARNTVAGADTGKFAILSYLPPLASQSSEEGYWGSQYSSWIAADWARGAKVAALGLFNLSDDYHSPSFIYPVARGAIQRLNPAAR